MERYRNRTHAGKILASYLKSVVKNEVGDLIVLGLPRGGVPVAYEVAKELNCPLNLWLVRKIGHPQHRDFAIGAISSDGGLLLHHDIIKHYHINKDKVFAIVDKERKILQEKEKFYYETYQPLNLKDKIVIVVDDGVATGASMRVAIETLKERDPLKIIVGTPVAPPDVVQRISTMVDHIECPLQPRFFMSVAQFYGEFNEVSDGEVKMYLSRISILI